MGEGVSQLLPIVAGVVATPAGECLVVEQPEIHLHPAAQADLADLFIKNLDASGEKQFVIESHSEHLLLRLRRRVAEGRISPSKIGVLIVDRSRGNSHVRALELTDRGHFEDWPSGFFEEGYEEALKLAHAAARKRSD
jgi:predicted ATPase